VGPFGVFREPFAFAAPVAGAGKVRAVTQPARTSKPRTPAKRVDPLAADVRQAARPGREQDAEDAFVRAVELLADDDPEQAVLAASAAKRHALRAPVVREVLGMALYACGRYHEAQSELLAYRRMSGRQDQNHVIADAYRALGASEKGLPLIREALTVPLPLDVRAELFVVGASALADMGRFDEALSLLGGYTHAEDIVSEPDLRVWYVTADVLDRAGRHTEAAAAFRRVLHHDAEVFDAQVRLEALEANS
jgi:tetratricopeptide (TPR) repeat protein